MKSDQEQVCALIKETVALLCRNGLSFNTSLRVQGLLGITVDDEQVFIVQMDEVLCNDFADSKPDIAKIREMQDFISTEYTARESADEAGCSKKQLRRRNIQRSFPRDANDAGMALYDGTASYANEVITIGEDEVDEEMKLDQDEQYGDLLDTESELYKPNPNFIYDSNFGDFVELPKMMPLRTNSADQLNQYETFDNNNQLVANTIDNSELQQQQCYSTVSRRTTAAKRGAERPYRGLCGRVQQHIKQEHSSSRPAKQIISKYRQQQFKIQQQGDETTDAKSFVLTQTFHQCGYPDCGKQYLNKQHLLRHQTEQHGRQPTRILAYKPTWIKPS